MEFLKDVTVKVSSLNLPSGIKARMKEPHVVELAESIRLNGGEPMNRPLFRWPVRDLIAGGDRMAATLLNKTAKITVRRVKCSDQEAKRLELDENLRRRQDNRKEMLAEASKLKAAELKAEQEAKAKEAKESGTPVPAKKPEPIKKQAREAVAAKAGIKAESVRKAEQRAKKAAEPKKEPPPPKPPVETLGVELSKGLIHVIDRIQVCTEEFQESSKTLLREVSRIAGILPAPVLVRLQDAAKALGDVGKEVHPACVCPKCRAKGDEKCQLCKGAHYVREEQMRDIPKEWMKPEPKADDQEAF